jgi:poly(A) polymerase
VGGCIRDLLLGKKPKDYDIATSATPTQIKNIFNNCRIIGKRFKIVHIIFKGKIVEVTTFRSLPDHRLNNKPASGELLLKRDNNYGNAKEDAARRDFTVNALYYDPRNESIIDYVGGFEDIKNKILRVVGNPDISFQEDPVRMLRAIKISVLHGLEIEKKTKQAIKKNKFEIEKASSSRMLEEYNKIFRTWETAQVFKGLAENHLLEVLFKEALDIVKKQRNWQENFLETSIGKLLVIADRKLKEREELTPTIFFALIFSDIVNDSLSKEKGNMITAIKNALDPICNRLEIPKKDRQRLIRIYASQKRFLKTTDANQIQNNLFRTKDFFYDSFMYFKLIAEATNNQEALQIAFFWEISARIRPDGKSIKQSHHQSHGNSHPRKQPREHESKNNSDDKQNKDHKRRNSQNKSNKNQNHSHEHKEQNEQALEKPIKEHTHKHEKHERKHHVKDSLDISIHESTQIVTTSEMEALEGEIPENEKMDSNPEETSTENKGDKQQNLTSDLKRKLRPKKRRFFKKKNQEDKESPPQESA